MSMYEQQAPKIYSVADATSQMAEFPFLSGSSHGTDVAISADGLTVLIGAPFVDAEPSDFPALASVIPGAAFVYVWDADLEEWVQQAKLTPEAAASSLSYFGFSVALSADGDTAAVGGPGDGAADTSDVLNEQRGAVWVFVRSGGGWSLQQRISDPVTAISLFGTAVALSPSGDRLAIGDPVAITDFGDPRGHAFIYERTGTSWSQSADLSVSPDDGHALGESVSFAGEDKLVIGAPFLSDWDEEGLDAHGTAWTAINDAGWSLTGTAVDVANNYRFGRRVAASATRLAVAGAYDPDHDGDQYIWVFDPSGDDWVLDTELSPTWSLGPGQEAAVSISEDGNTIIVGNGTTTSEVCEVWARDGLGAWASLGTFTADDLDTPTRFGRSVDMSPDSAAAIIGGPGDADEIGAAWVFTRTLAPLTLKPALRARIPLFS